jgi:hypothetical protein
MNKETNCSIEFLKCVTGKFDIETVFMLNLQDRNISKLNSIIKCKNVIHLNLSYNKLNNLSGIEMMTDIVYLDLSNNILTTVDGLEYCTKIKNLKLIGNKIEYTKNFARLKTLINLENLSFQELNQNEKTVNPICLINEYRNEMFKIFTSLRSLDGTRKKCEVFYQKLNSNDCDFFKINTDDFNFNIKDQVKINIDDISSKDNLDKNKAILDNKYNEFQRELENIKNSLKN